MAIAPENNQNDTENPNNVPNPHEPKEPMYSGDKDNPNSPEYEENRPYAGKK